MAENINEIKLGSAEYPAVLREIPFPPKKISVWSKNGGLPKTKHYLSIVGTRRNSAYGEEILRKIIAGLARHDFTIVSGMATGIDTIAHKSALENKIQTVAVLGSGISPAALYPKQNLRMAEEIVSSGGAVISEYDYDMKATLWSFPQRNRIISGLSRATLVVEAPEKSGSMITARFALDQNRDILAIPNSVFSQNAYGTHKLIKQGAALIESAEDVLRAYGIEVENAQLGGLTAKLDLSPEENKILEILIDPADIDTLIRKSKMASHTAQAIIGLLEIRGIIKKIGNEYVKNI